MPPRDSLASGGAFHITSVRLKSDSFLFITAVPPHPEWPGTSTPDSLVPSLSVPGHRLQPGGGVLGAHPSILPCLLALAADPDTPAPSLLYHH